MKFTVYHAIDFPKTHFASFHTRETLFHHECSNPEEKLCFDDEFSLTSSARSAFTNKI
jgi:hypothetical protein